MQGKCKKALKSFQRTLVQVPLLVSFYVYVLFIFPTVFGNTLQTCHLSLLHFCMYFLQMEDFWCWTVPLSSQEVDAGTLLLSDLLTLFRLYHLSHWCPLQQKKILLAQCSGAVVHCVWCGFVLVLFSNRRKSLFGSYCFRELEFMALMADNTAAGRQAGSNSWGFTS